MRSGSAKHSQIHRCHDGHRRLFANNDHLFVLTDKESVVVIELAELDARKSRRHQLGHVMRNRRDARVRRFRAFCIANLVRLLASLLR